MMIEYRSFPINPFSNNIFIMIILVLNLTDKPIPNRIDCFIPISFFPAIRLANIFDPFVTITINKTNNGDVSIYLRSIVIPTHRKNIGAKNP